MATHYITWLTNGAELVGSFRHCLKQATNGDIITLDPVLFPTGGVYTVDLQGEAIDFSKNVTLTAGEKKILKFISSKPFESRAIRLRGDASSSTPSVALEGVWFDGLATAALVNGVIIAQDVTLSVNRCAFLDMNAGTNTSGIYLTGGVANFDASLFSTLGEFVLNYSTTAAVNVDRCTFIGRVKAGFTGDNSIVIPLNAVDRHFVDPSVRHYALQPSSPYASGGTILTATVDLYGNPYAADDALGAIANDAGSPETLTAILERGEVVFRDKATDWTRPVYQEDSNGWELVATTAAAGYHAGDVLAVKLLVYQGATSYRVEADIPPDFEWLRSCFASLGIPVRTVEEAMRIIPNCDDLFRRYGG